MNQKKRDTNETKSKNHSHSGHMRMMAICCGVPIIGFLALAILGVSLPSLETVFLLICPIGMIGMMYMMHRDSSAKATDLSCSKSEQTKDAPPVNIALNGGKAAEQIPANPKQPGSLKAKINPLG